MTLKPLIDSFPYLLQGIVNTLIIAVLGIFIGTLGGVAAGLLRFVPWRLVRELTGRLIEFIRAIPLLLLIFFIFFGLPSLGAPIGMYPAAVLALSLWMTANTSEVVRGGVQSIRQGQTEAARSLGLSGLQAMRYVVFPQAVRRMLPPYVGLCTIVIKDTSLAALIGVLELTRAVQDTVAWSRMPIVFYLLAAAVYFCICYPLSLAARSAEKRLQRS
jgi:polar amino acid transport system permease protein